MTPGLSLSYTSDLGRKASPFGAGWSLNVPSVKRSTRKGFPPLTQQNKAVQVASKEVAEIARDPDPFLTPSDIAPEVLSVLLRHSSALEKASQPEAAVAPPPAGVFEYKGMVNLSTEVSGALVEAVRSEPVLLEKSVTLEVPDRLEVVAQSVIGTRLAQSPSYDDDLGEFETKDGVLSRTQDGPSDAKGALYQPQREHRPVRYEYRTGTGSNGCGGGMWIEHDPSGIKRYYGCDESGKSSAQVTTELGTFEWLLVSEVDPHGNSIEYTYHNIEGRRGQYRINRYEPQDQPILATVSWGGNLAAKVPHPYKVATKISGQNGGMDSLRGHVLLNHRVDSLDVIGPKGHNYWSYDFIYSTSADTGNQLLFEVRRRASSEDTRSWRLSYTSNGGKVRWGAPQEVSGALGLAYVQHPRYSLAERQALLRGTRYKPAELKEALWPSYSRSGVKIMDYNGDGLADYFYNTAHVVVPQAPLDNLAIQGPAGGWHSQFARPMLGGAPSMAGMPMPSPQNNVPMMPEGWEEAFAQTMTFGTVHGYADMDGDHRLDMVGFDIALTEWADWMGSWSALFDSDPSVCQSLWATCCESGLSCYPDVACMASATCVESLDPTQSIIRNPENVLADLAFRPQVDVGLGKWSPSAGSDPVLYHGGGCSAMAKAMCTNTFVPSFGSLFEEDCGYDDPCDINVWVANPVCAYMCEEQRPFHGRSANVFINGLPSTLHDWPVAAMQKFVVTRKYTTANWDDDARKALQDTPVPFDVVTASGFETQMVDVNGDGLSDIVLIKNKNMIPGNATAFQYLPRVYLNRGALGGPLKGAPDVGDVMPGDLEHFSQFLLDAEKKGVAQFSSSLQGILLGGRKEACYFGAKGNDVAQGGLCDENDVLHPYPKAQQFNSIFLDLNADGLPDLVSAVPPAQKNGKFGKCQVGHRVHLNRGYRWDVDAQLALPAQTWSATGPLTRTKNYTPEHARFTENGTPYTGYCDSGDYGLNADVLLYADFESDELTPVDINGDGRVDLLFSVIIYESNSGMAQLKQAVYLNTGRGFVLAPNIGFPMVRRKVMVFASNDGGVKIADLDARMPTFEPFFTKMRQRNRPEPIADLGRIVDINGDTLPDIVVPGICSVMGPPCTRAQWVPNLNAIPDLLSRVETGGGAWTNISYEVASSTSGRQLLLDDKVPPGAVVVKEIRRAALPQGPAETISMRYAGYINDAIRHENLGFTMVQAQFKNASPAGMSAPRDSELTVTHFFHRNREETDTRGAAVPLAYPLKGLALEVQTSGTTDGVPYTSRQRRQYAIETRGRSARVREAGTYNIETRGSLEQMTGSEVLAWDEHGYPTRTRSGNARVIDASGRVALVEDREMVEQDVETDSFPRAWVLGLAKRERVSGFTRDEYGVSKEMETLAEVRRRYDQKGLLLSEQRISTRPAEDCTAGNEDQPALYTYHSHGLVASVIKGEREMRYVYDTETGGLRATTHTTWATRYIDGVAQGRFPTPLSETQYLDPRTGAVESMGAEGRSPPADEVQMDWVISGLAALCDTKKSPLSYKGPCRSVEETNADNFF
jgi:hypothetical protein